MLFGDLVGSTAFGEQVDAESAREAMARYHHMVQNVIDAHGGTVAKFIGDGVMAMFGIPEVAEDDADRAVAAGLGLQRDFEAIRAHIHDRYDVEVGLRVGINTGEVVIADQDADIVGDALNTAARLEAACTPGRVLVGEDTWRLTRSHITYEVLGEVMVKGKSEPVATFQVVEQAGDEDELATPFVGRDAELDQLRRVLVEATEERTAKLVTVIGAPGVGKTRLALELARAHGDTVTWFDLRCERNGTATFAPVAELLRTAADISSDATAQEATEAIGRFVDAGVPDRDRLVDLLGSFVGAAMPRSTEEMFFAARRLVEVVADRQPALLVVDDIQWAEELFLDLLEHLAEWVRDAPVLIVALARPEIREIQPALAETGRRVSAVLSVEGLDAGATERLAAQLLGADTLPHELTDRLPESTEGNPLFVRELVRMMVDDGVVARAGDRWEMAVDPDAVQVPPTIQSLLSTRVERMPADERRVVELASVVGSEFPRGAVGTLVNDMSSTELQATIDRLRRKEIIEPSGAYWGDEPVFRFHHVLIRDAAYRRLLKRTRAELHLQVGEWTERTAAILVGEHEPSIAFHYEQCHRFRTELGLSDADTAAIGDRAAALLRVAADRALERDDLSSAGGLARRALATISTDAPTRSDLLLLACEALLSSGDVAGGRGVLDQLEEVAGVDDRLEAWSACFHAQLITLTSPQELSFAEASVDGAAERLAALGDDAGVAKARQVRAGALARLGRVGDCEAELDLALTAARAAEDRRRVTAVLGSAPVAALWGPSPVPRAGGRCLDVIRLLRITTGSPAVEATSVRCQAVLEALRGRFDTARTMLETSRATAVELGLRHGLMETELYAGIVELLAGEALAAEPHLREAYGGLGKLGIGADAGQAAAYLARALLLQGQLDEAEDLASASDALAGQNPQTLIAARSVEAEILSARRDHETAVELAEEAVGLADGRDIVVDHAQACMVLARVRRAAGDDAGADQARAEAERLFDLKGATVELDDTTMQTRGKAGFPESEPPRAASASSGVTQPGPRLENAASAVARELLEAVIDGNRRQIDALLAEEHVLEDHRPISDAGPVRGRERGAQALVDLGDMISGANLQVVATRGDRLCLASIEWDYANWGPQRGLHVIQIDGTGRQVLTVNFSSAELAEAAGELDRLYLETLDPARGAVFRVLAEMNGDINAGDGVSIISAVDALTADGIVLRHEILVQRKIVVDGSIQVALIENGQVTRTETFDADQLDAALARFGEWTSVSEATALENECTRVAAFIDRAFEAGDWDGYIETFAEPFVYDPHHRGPRYGHMSTRAELLANMRTRHELGYVHFEADVVAIRGEAMALRAVTMRTDAGDIEPSLLLFVLDDEGKVVRIAVWDSDDLASAVAELDRLFIETEGAEHAAVLSREAGEVDAAVARFDELTSEASRSRRPDATWERLGPTGVASVLDNAASRAQRQLSAFLDAGDHIAARQLLANGLERIDHRRTVSAEPIQDADSWIEARLALLEVGGFSEPDARTLAVRGDQLALSHVEVTNEAGTAMDLLVVVRLDVAGRIDHVLNYDHSDLADAVAELDRLYLENLPPEPTGAPESDPVAAPRNRAVGLLERSSRLFAQPDLDGFADTLAEDLVFSDRRTGPAGGREVRGRTDFMVGIRQTASVGFARYAVEPIAVRGDDLVLADTPFFSENGLVDARLGIYGYDADGRADLVISYDADAIEQAIVELDRLYFESLGEEFAAIGEVSERLRQAGGARDVERWRGLLAEDFVGVDHRAHVPLPETDRDEWLDMVAQQREVAGPGRAYAAAHHVVQPNGGVVTSVIHADPTAGSGFEWRHLNVFLTRGDKISRFEIFDEPDLPAAIARFEELTATPEPDRFADPAPWLPLGEWNAGAARVLELADSGVAGDREAVLELTSPRLARIDHRHGVAAPQADRDAWIQTFLDMIEVIGPNQQLTLIAQRGDRLALHHGVTTSEVGFELAFLFLVRLDDDGRFDHFENFDAQELPAAVARLDELYLQGEGAAHASILRPLGVLVAAAGSRDVSGWEATLAEDAVVVDHRMSVRQEFDRDAWLETIRAQGQVAGAGVAWIPYFDRLVDEGGIGPIVQRSTSPGGVDAEWVSIGMSLLDDGRITRMEIFEDDGLERARARFEELRSVPWT